MPCALCKRWEKKPTWQPCGVRKDISEKVQYNNSWWFFLCDECTQDNKHEKWHAFNSTDGKGIWWWNESTKDWFLEQEPGKWAKLINSEGTPQWCHPDGRCFNAFQDPWQASYPHYDEGWQAFDDANKRGTWWWNKYTEEWFAESEPGDWFITTRDNKTIWLHMDGRCFSASLEPWLIDEQETTALLPDDLTASVTSLS